MQTFYWDGDQRISAEDAAPRLLAEIARLHSLIQAGLAYGDGFKTLYAAGARAELRRAAGMTPPTPTRPSPARGVGGDPNA